jgi:ABC-type glycerol-3-phosphate transport system substrate-binding protein
VALKDGFNEKFDGNITLVEEEIPYNQLNEKMAAYVAAGDSPDISAAFTGYTLDFYTQGILAPVDEWLGQEWIDTLVPALSKEPHGDVIDGHMYMAYYSMSLLAIMARRDILSQAGIEPYSMKTFDEYVAGAAKIADETDIKSPISMTLGTPLANAETSRWIFTSHGLNNIADFRPEKKNDYLAALDAMLKMAPHVPEAAFTWDYGNADQGYAEGITAFYAIGDWYFGSIYNQAPHAVSEEFSIPIPYPGGPTFKDQSAKFNGSGWYLLSGSEHKEEAAEFLRFGSNKETLLKYSDSGSILPFKDVTVEEQLEVSKFGEEQRWYYRDWLKLVNDFTLTVDIPYVAAAETQQIWHDAVVNVMRGQLEPDEAYEQMAGRIVPLQERFSS